jgi:hypothetical protein
MNILKELESTLKEARNSGEYWGKGVPSSMMKMDIELNRVIGEYILLSNEEKKSVRKGISTDSAWLLLCFATNMATYSLRLSEQKYFSNGLTALSMILGVIDQREILLIMPLYYDACKQKDLSFEKILKQNDEFATFIRSFLSRNEDDKTLECMGYKLVMDENNNPIYQRTW